VEGNMASGKTTYAKARSDSVYINHDLLREKLRTFEAFYAEVVRLTKNYPTLNFIIDGWNTYDASTIKSLIRDSGHSVTVTVFYTPYFILQSRDNRNTKVVIQSKYALLVGWYKKDLVNVPFSFCDQNGLMSFSTFMKRLRADEVNATEADVEQFKRDLANQEHYDRYYQTIMLPYGLSIQGYERTEDTWQIIQKNVDFRGKTVLDVGCYHGYCCFMAEDAGAISVIGLEKQERILAFTKRLCDMWHYQTRLLHEDIDAYALADRFDIVLCLNMIQYVQNPQRVAWKLCTAGRLVVVEATKEHKRLFDNVVSHVLIKTLESPRTRDLKRKLYIYQKKTLLPQLQWFNIMQVEGQPLRMFFNDVAMKNVGLAESFDGYNFQIQEHSVFAVDSPRLFRNWDTSLIESHSTLPLGKAYRMYYCGHNGHWQIGVADSVNLKDWVRSKRNPVLKLGKQSWENREVADPHVLHDGSQYLMYYAGKGTDWQTGIALSEDGLRFHRYEHNPILTTQEKQCDGGIVLSGIIKNNGAYLAAIQGYSWIDKKYRCFLYQSENGLDWEHKKYLGEGKLHPELHLVNEKWLLYYTNLGRYYCVEEITLQ
jgi:2-polyprenyl-3-methyl-5-hydroxy-6-metoxy-1,4-benzoquinol methylase